MKTIFYHHFGAFDAIAHLFSGMRDVYYFNSSVLARLVVLLSRQHKVKAVPFSLATLKDLKGEHYWKRIYNQHLLQLCRDNSDRLFGQEPVIKMLSDRFGKSSIFLYFRKVLEKQLTDYVIFLQAIVWCREQGIIDLVAPAVFVIPKSFYGQILHGYGPTAFGVAIVECLSIRSIALFIISITRQFGKIAPLLFRALSRFASFLGSSQKLQSSHERAVMVGIPYMGIGMGLEKKSRCEFPWLLHSIIPLDQVLVYFRRGDVPISAEPIQEWSKHGLQYCSLVGTDKIDKTVRRSIPSLKAVLQLIIWMMWIIIRGFRQILMRNWQSIFLVGPAIDFVISYILATEFYTANNIKVVIDYDIYATIRIAEQKALADFGGVSIGYQLSHWSFAGSYLATQAQTMFLFGPYYADIFREGDSPSSTILYSGYITDYAFDAVKERANSLRQALCSRGAQRIIAYFDENSSDDRMSMILNKTASAIYKNFLEMVIFNPKLGLIIHPKKPTTLFKRLPDIKPLFEQAVATGRCILQIGLYRTTAYPTETAQAADLCVASLLGGTVALESMLSGVKTVMIDLEGMRSSPEYQWGKNRIVFDSLDGLMSALKPWVLNSDSAGIGDLSVVLNLSLKDPFQDGNASKRIAHYIAWLLEKFNTKASAAEATVYANHQYQQHWPTPI